MASAGLPPAPDLRPLLETLKNGVEESERRRQQSFGELQQAALELAIAVASQLVFQALAKETFAVEELVRQAVAGLGLEGPMTASLHPADHELLRKRLTGQALPWPEGKLALQADASVARGGCRIETPEGRMLVSDISTRLSEIRRHWMEELDDAQIERRRAHDQGQPLRRFPDRREAP